jgi:hypothetical protein
LSQNISGRIYEASTIDEQQNPRGSPLMLSNTTTHIQQTQWKSAQARLPGPTATCTMPDDLGVGSQVVLESGTYEMRGNCRQGLGLESP